MTGIGAANTVAAAVAGILHGAGSTLKVSPGIWPQSSGGQTGAPIEVTGYPSGGEAR